MMGLGDITVRNWLGGSVVRGEVCMCLQRCGRGVMRCMTCHFGEGEGCLSKVKSTLCGRTDKMHNFCMVH